MKKRNFIGIAGVTVLAAAGASYLLSDKRNFNRDDTKLFSPQGFPLFADEREILFLASLAPSGHNTQPWFVKYIDPYHWIICNDKSRWLSAVDPTQRETILYIGAFMQNLEYAASDRKYSCQFTLLAKSNQDENVVDVRLLKVDNAPRYDVKKIEQRRTVRSNYLNDLLKKEDVDYL